MLSLFMHPKPRLAAVFLRAGFENLKQKGGFFMQNKITTKQLTLSAVMIAVATVLSLLKVFEAPYGGSVTLASMVPIIFVACKYNTAWGLLTGFVFSLLQMLVGGVSAPPTENFGSYALVVLLDYVIAFTVLGGAGVVYRRFKNSTVGVVVASAVVVALRFVCHYLSGILIWDVYAPEGQSPYLYSLVYNGGYMLCELIITCVVMALLSRVLLKEIERR